MARDRTARTRIRNHLVTHGPVDDPSGHATGALKDAIGYQGSSVAFIQLIAAMDADGEIVRDIRGKRTYRISGGPALDRTPALTGTPSGPALADLGDVRGAVVRTEAGALVIDYDELARALVRELWTFATAQAAPAGTSAELELRAEHERMTAERDEYARRLELARTKLDELLGARSPQEDAAVRA